MSPTAQFWITTGIAILALALSSLSLYLQWQERRPQLRVTARVATRTLSVDPHGIGGLPGPKDVPVLSVYLSNPSEKLIHIAAVCLVPNRGSLIELKEFNMLYGALFTPFTIESYRGHEFIVRGQQLADELKRNGHQDRLRCTIEIRDEVGKRYKSRPIQFAISQLLEV